MKEKIKTLFARGKRRRLFLILLLCLFIVTGCFKHYYKSISITAETSTAREKTNILVLMYRMNKYIILHYNDRHWHFKQVNQDPETGNVHGIIEPVNPLNETIMRTRGEARSMRYDMTEQKSVLEQTHVFLNGYNFHDGDSSSLTVNGSQIERIDMNKRDGGRTFGSHALGILTIGAIALAAFVVVLAIVCNCPQLAIMSDGTEVPQGALFPGAMGASLERRDMVILDESNTKGDTLRLRISNKLPETEFINEIKLFAVPTQEHTHLATDPNSNLIALTPLAIKTKAASPSGVDASEKIASIDTRFYDFTETGSDEELNKLFVTFEKPQTKQNCLLVVNARQSRWMEQVADFGFQQMGTLFPVWAKRLDKADPLIFRRKNISRGISLNVYKKSEGNWLYIGSFEQAGTLAYRTMVLPLGNIDQHEKLELKFETAFGFWEIDYVSITDHWTDKAGLQEIPVHLATHKSGGDVRAELSTDDKSYLQLTKMDDHADLVYIAKRKEGTRLVLSAKGFYRHERKYTNKPNYDFIKEMRRDRLKYHQLSTILYAYRSITMEQNGVNK